MNWYYKLDVKDAIVTVRPWHGAWWYSFTYLDGSKSTGDADWHPNEREAKARAKQTYQFKLGKRIKRAKWRIIRI